MTVANDVLGVMVVKHFKRLELNMKQVLRRLLLVLIWASIIFYAGRTSFYSMSVTNVTDDLSSLAAVIPLAIGASIIIVFMLVGYIFHRIINYIFGLPPKTNF